ncbi:hypothetical protein Pmani_020775 [Petrolisthes manimaculis]|uniref:Uncharacterized protein n=1 Tax=Petrolisthes manimaculis TaxID=1843537 RepID=A0AAE1PG28_9EUCA|nr:hypothetical protein Pmani_020775 [Petrolisthes manimaculis]
MAFRTDHYKTNSLPLSLTTWPETLLTCDPSCCFPSSLRPWRRLPTPPNKPSVLTHSHSSSNSNMGPEIRSDCQQPTPSPLARLNPGTFTTRFHQPINTFPSLSGKKYTLPRLSRQTVGYT